eukprot:3381828-Alexandrium_andersonii.AAC.1
MMYTAVGWDYSSAFDRVSPDICCSLWISVGIPELVADRFHDIWKGIQRVVELEGQTAKAT